MGISAHEQVDIWLRDGGIVVTASDRAARALRSVYHRARLAEGLTAWPAPRIFDWRTFVREAWAERTLDSRLVLNSAQEQSVWEQIATRSQQPATLLDGPRHRVAALAMEAHELLATHAPRYLHSSVRKAWQQDAAGFSAWLSEFDTICREGNLVSANRLPLELTAALRQSNNESRSPLLLAGFDRILPAQAALLGEWGEWRQTTPDPAASPIRSFHAQDPQTESDACALWCRQKIALNPSARLLIITPNAAGRRGELERALLRHLDSSSTPVFEFSLGLPLSQVPLARTAFLLLRWLSSALGEAEVDWLFSTAHSAANSSEASALERLMRELRRRDRQRTHWSLDALCREPAAQSSMPSAWKEHMRSAQSRLSAESQNSRNPVEWAALVPELLNVARWPGFRPLTSVEFQAASRWSQAVETCGSVGFDGRRIQWHEFLSALSHALDETLFAPESSDAPVQIAGPAESAGIEADAIWFLGADDAAWPASGSAHPLLPLYVQREGAMPHAAPQLDLELAAAITARVLASASEVNFSFAIQQESVEARGSRLIARLAGSAQPVPAELRSQPAPQPAAELFEDSSSIPFPHRKVAGGSDVLTLQSQCPFKAFATMRLGAKSWQSAQAGLSASQRGKLLHSVMRAIWSGKPRGIASLDDLQALPDRRAFVADHVRRILDDEIPAAVRDRMPRRYLELEKPRLTGLICEWLEYESTRNAFTVAKTEAAGEAVVAGLALDLRLDRLDRLNDGSLLVIDYKTGNISSSSWEMPRPDNLQLPLYAGFALDREQEPLGGLAFAKIRPGKHEFAALAFAPDSTLFAGLKGAAAARRMLTLEQLSGWRDYIAKLADEFIAGRAEADPRDYPKTCDSCDLHTLCRIDENRAFIGDDELNGEESSDE